jgi:hypothetical protein
MLFRCSKEGLIMPSEIVLEIGADGGSLTVVGEKSKNGKWNFRVVRDETTIHELLSEEDLEGLVLFDQSEYVPSLQDALKRLDKYPWFRLYPLEIHPEFFDIILSEVRKRAGVKEETRWREILIHRSPLRNEINSLTVGIHPAYSARMALSNQLTGMLGVYLTAAELTARGFIVSPTSRSARGADLLVTDQSCQHAWSVQVKTNASAKNDWILSKGAEKLKSASHIYVFVNLKGKDLLDRPDYLVLPSEEVAGHIERYVAKSGKHGTEGGSVWFYFARNTRPKIPQGWEVFGNPMPLESENGPTPHGDQD